jgi:aryl carrier-like protein
MRNFTNFADLARHIADGRATDAQVQSYDGSFLDYSDMAKLSTTDAPERLEMPDPDQVRAAVEMMMATLFDVFRDTRMEPFATDLAWGFVNSFHVVAKRVEGREDDAAKKLGELARHYDPSEIYATEVEDAQTLCQTLQGCREALECMRDHAGEVYRVEVGKPFSPVKGSRVSSGLTASMIDARDYLASRSRTRREQYEPQGPVVAFSGGQQWEDADLLFSGLDSIKARIPEMILATTTQSKGCDAIAHAWAASRGVKVIQFRLDRSLGNRAAFVRNDRILALKPVHAVICEGTGIQANLAQKLRQAGVPLNIVRLAQQTIARRA